MATVSRIHPRLLRSLGRRHSQHPRYLGPAQDRVGLGLLGCSLTSLPSVGSIRFLPNHRSSSISLFSTSSANASSGGGDRPSSTSPYPSFTTGESFKDFVKSPGIDICLNVALLGLANTPLKGDAAEIDIDEFTQGALYAIEVVTNILARDEVEARAVLREQLTQRCLDRLHAQLSQDQRKALEVKKEDVVFSWIAKAASSLGDTRLVFATMSMRKFGQIRRDFDENNQRSKAFMDDLKERKPDAEKAKQMLDEFRATLHTPFEDFRQSDFLISNFGFVRKDGQWLIDQMSMRPGKELYTNPLYYFRCKGRIGFSLRGTRYISVLRYDYISDLAIVILFILLVMSSLKS